MELNQRYVYIDVLGCILVTSLGTLVGMNLYVYDYVIVSGKTYF